MRPELCLHLEPQCVSDSYFEFLMFIAVMYITKKGDSFVYQDNDDYCKFDSSVSNLTMKDISCWDHYEEDLKFHDKMCPSSVLEYRTFNLKPCN